MVLDPSKATGARKVSQVPRFVPPELATLVKRAPRGEQWSHEIKFDGYRALVRIENGSSEIRSRNDKDWTDAYRVLAAELAKLPVENAILDGEVVVRSPDGTTSFEALRHVARVPGADDADTARKRAEVTSRLVYYVFDLLFLNGFDLLETPLEERRSLLKRILDKTDGGNRILMSDSIAGDGPTVLAKACGLGLEGVVSKRISSPYRPGVRGTEWVKSKCRHEQEFVIGGFTDPSGTRAGFGALLLGVYGDRGLRYVSKVGTGFDERLLRDLGRRLRALEVAESPFAENLMKDLTGVHWVKPQLVAQVSFMEWTSSGGLRHATFLGLRDDKPPTEIVAEVPAAPPERRYRS
jgi:bifunctional non-homologous end joining protein LigD